MVRAVRFLPVRLTAVSPMRRSNSVPDSTVWSTRALGCADAEPRNRPRLAAAPPIASPLTNVRREGCRAG
jgi:hypothetical protein